MLIFKCPTSWCGKEASTLDAVALVQHDGYHCDVCDALLEPLSTTQGSGGLTQEQRQALLDLQVQPPLGRRGSLWGGEMGPLSVLDWQMGWTSKGLMSGGPHWQRGKEQSLALHFEGRPD